MSDIGFPQQALVFVDSQGRLTRDAMYFLLSLWNRTGGSTGASSGDLSTDMPEDAGIEELKADLFASRDTYGQLPPTVVLPADDDANGRLQSLESMVTFLRNEIEALKQGMML